ncbi:MAG: Maf family protein, partial [Planctomycetota bacterium]|nr:Maf family protein [Planctomycetota bacterium]
MLILASASPARKELLQKAGFSFQVLPVNIRELKGRGRTLQDTVLENARRKAIPIARKRPDSWVLSADTMIEFEGRIYGKPSGREEGVTLLYRMGGKAHLLATGFVLRRGKRIIEKVVESQVTIRPTDKKTLRKHVTKPQRFAGGYSIRKKKDPVVQKV